MNRKSFVAMMALVVAVVMAGSAMAAPVFSDDFESGLSLWTAKSGGTTSGQIIVDPMNNGNHVLHFTDTVIAGDIFSSQPFAANPNQMYRLSFDFLGEPGDGAIDSGGFIGYANGTSYSLHHWVAGTERRYIDAGSTVLQDNVGWKHYNVLFKPAFSSIRVMLEDFAYAGDVAGDAYFDNIRVTAVPLPAAGWAGLGLLGVMGIIRRRMHA
ncbi:MAG: VPLPA-CTERM sorting domain-containing protein [Bacillota bacterium]